VRHEPVKQELAARLDRRAREIVPRPRSCLLGLIAAAFASLMLAPAAAEEPAGSGAEPAPSLDSSEHPPFRAGLLDRQTLFDDWGDVRTALENAGIQLGITYSGETLSNLHGGLRQGTNYQGLVQVDLDIDGGKVLGRDGLTLHATAYQIHGKGLTAARVGNLLTVSNIEATAATRLSTLYVEEKLAAGMLSARAGLLAADDEFLISEYAVPLVNSTFGWPAAVGLNLPSGGPAYPLATPGVRGRAGIADGLTLMAGVFNGDPVGPGSADPQRRDPSGTAFRLSDDVFAIAELGYEVSEAKRPSGLSGTYKLGGWYHGGSFPDQRVDATGLSLADPASSGQPAVRGTNFGLYAAVDQMLWRHAARHGEWIGGFLRLAGSPADRNLVDFYVDAGITANGIIPGREYDIVSFGLAYAGISRDARRLDRDTRAFTGTDVPLRDFEAVLELTYQAHIAAWLIVQPDLQFVVHPGGHAAVPGGTAAIPDAVVAGLRTVIRF
jgi:porin